MSLEITMCCAIKAKIISNYHSIWNKVFFNLILKINTLLIVVLPTIAVASKKTYFFDPILFRGATVSSRMLQQFNQPNSIIPGEYKVDIYINGNFFKSSKIKFIEDANNAISPCFDSEIIKQAVNVVEPVIKNTGRGCFFLEKLIPSAQVKVNLALLRVDLTIPDADLPTRPRGYVDVSSLDAGTSIFFLTISEIIIIFILTTQLTRI